MTEFGFNKKAYEALPVGSPADRSTTRPRPSRSTALTDYHAKNAIALERLKTEFKGKVEIVQFPVPVLRDLKKLATEVVKEESEKTPMARKVHASFTKFQAHARPLGPRRRRRLPSVRGACDRSPTPTGGARSPWNDADSS